MSVKMSVRVEGGRVTNCVFDIHKWSFILLPFPRIGVGSVQCVYMNKQRICHKSRTKIILFLPRRLEFENYPSIMSIFVWKYIIKFRHALICLSLIFSFVLSTHLLTICPSNKCEMSLSFLRPSTFLSNWTFPRNLFF